LELECEICKDLVKATQFEKDSLFNDEIMADEEARRNL